METILACYFNTLKDPQRHIYWEGNNFAIIADLYFSLQRLNLNGIIFHDHLNEEFINKWQTDRIRFIYYKPERNTNNDRWRCYYNYLQENEIDKVFCLDLDVIININPFRLKDKLICGSEDRTIGNCGYMIDNFNISYKTIYFPDKKVLNCGIFGGNKKTVVFLLEQILKDFDLINSDVNIDMSVFNKVLYSNNIEIKTGYPIHTKFMSNLNNLNCYFKHK